jgi:hypothetical protein
LDVRRSMFDVPDREPSRFAAGRRKPLETLGEGCVKTEWQGHAYCLMGNHFPSDGGDAPT